MLGSSFRLMGGLKAFSAEFRRSVTRVLPTFLVALLAVLPSWQALGDPATADQASRVVQGWLRADASPLETALGQQVKQVDTYKDTKGLPLYYVVNLEPKGFVIVAADDLVEPIIAFVPDGTYDPSSDNPLAVMVSNDMPNRLASVRSVQALSAQGAVPTAQSKWGRLIAASQLAPGADLLGIATVSDIRVAPMVQTLWDQSTDSPFGRGSGNAVYNYYTPNSGNGSANNYVCGCVATAMAQLMRFWQYPVSYTGTNAYPVKIDGVWGDRLMRGGDGSGGAYAWNLMVTNPATGSTEPQRQAIGALCSDAGVSVNMSYTSGESSSALSDGANALRNTFQYANAINGRGTYNVGMFYDNIGPTLISMINPNLDSGSPVLLGIRNSSTAAGHAIVCDGYGYDSLTLYHHLNMGWSGQGNVWYNLPNVDAVVYSMSYLYDSINVCNYNIWTNGVGEIISGRVTDSGGASAIAGVTVTATRVGGGTHIYTATTDSRGIYSLPRIPSSSSYTLSAGVAGYNFPTQQIIQTGFSEDTTTVCGNKWGINFLAGDINAPSRFSAVPVSTNQINLTWVKNAANHNVMVAWNTVNTFGTPSGSYSAGNTISGGGTVLYNGSGTSLSHSSGLAAGTKCYYRAWSVSTGPSYSTGAAGSATTDRGSPFNEGFENSGALPEGWSQERVTKAIPWSANASSPHGGGYSARLAWDGERIKDYSEHKTKMVTPMINFGGSSTNALLTFWHKMGLYKTYQDELRVYYKTSATGTWTLLQAYTTSVAAWTQQTVALPNANSSYYIGFEGNAKNGDFVYIDDVQVTGTVTSGGKSSQTITGFTTPASALTTNTFALSATATPSGLPVSYAVISGVGSLAGSTLSFTGAGSVQVVASQAGNASYDAAPSITNTITVTKATAQVSLTAATLTQTNNGSQRFVTASTVPAGLLTNITYNGSTTAPTAAGNYAVVGSVDASVAMYQGSASGTLVVQSAGVQTYYVATNGNDTANGISWATAKKTIQAAVDLTAAGDTVLVSNGVYATGLRLTPNFSSSNRVVITTAIKVRSVNGPAVTLISGATHSLTESNGTAAVRCIYLGANAVLSGFTLTNGHTTTVGNYSADQRGGAVYCDTTSSIVSNCIVTGSSACNWGGGAEGCTFYNCLFTGNWVGQGGGAMDGSILNNCTVVGNRAALQGGGTQGGTLNNCIAYFNTAPDGANYYSTTLASSCTTPGPGGNNISGDPLFVNAAGGNFRLQASSPCINQGSNTYVAGSADLDNNPRIFGTTVDMGAYEYQGASTVTLTASCEAIGTVTPTSTNIAIGGSAVFTIECSSRFHRILDIKMNGASAGLTFDSNSPITPTDFTWSNVQAAGSLYVTFTNRVTSDPGQPTFTWLNNYGLTRDTNGVNGSYSDTDHDGLTAWQEYLAGTDPTNAASALRMQQVSSAGGSNMIRWMSSATVRSKYNLYSRTNLASGGWSLYTNNITSTPPTNTLVLPALGRTRMFFKVSVTN